MSAYGRFSLYLGVYRFFGSLTTLFCWLIRYMIDSMMLIKICNRKDKSIRVGPFVKKNPLWYSKVRNSLDSEVAIYLVNKSLRVWLSHDPGWNFMLWGSFWRD